MTDYKHKNIGAVASLGMYQGVAQMFGRIKVRGFLGVVLHRTYHVAAMPTWNRKIRIAAGWTGALLLRREVVALGSLHDRAPSSAQRRCRPSRVPSEAGETAGSTPRCRPEGGAGLACREEVRRRPPDPSRREPSPPGSRARVLAAGRMARAP